MPKLATFGEHPVITSRVKNDFCRLLKNLIREGVAKQGNKLTDFVMVCLCSLYELAKTTNDPEIQIETTPHILPEIHFNKALGFLLVLESTIIKNIVLQEQLRTLKIIRLSFSKKQQGGRFF